MPDTLHFAVQHHQHGRLHEAARLYQAILAVQPGHLEALHLLGVVAHQ
jgi:protein O-GlcNAc transferase